MAITWTGTNGLATQIGKDVVGIDNEITRARTTLKNELDALADTLEAGDAGERRKYVALAYANYEQARRDSVAKMIRHWESIKARLLDRDTVLDQINLPDDNIERVLDRLMDEMDHDAQTVLTSVVTLGSVSADADNTGNGVILADKVLDGVTPPAHYLRPHRFNDGVNSELAVTAETCTVECVKDANGTILPELDDSRARTLAMLESFAEGEELWRIYGGKPWSIQIPGLKQPPFGTGFGFEAKEGSGEYPQLVKTFNASKILNNPNFEHFSTENEPDNWGDGTSAGTAGTHVFKDTTSANVRRGLASLEFRGNGVITEIQRAQKIPAQSSGRSMLIGRKRYIFSIWIKASASVANGDLTIQFEGTGYTAAGSEKITVAAPSLPTSWTHKYFYINMPATIPADLVINISWDAGGSAITNAKSLWLDDACIAPVIYHGGYNVAIIAGSTPWKARDKATFTVSNSDTGTFQRFARRAIGMQFLSATPAPTIPDNLFTP